ncbi:hypothetical protein V3C99_018654 [Haemonchus contortus]|uniref:Endo/exonuclease/phosphatase domain-containing protein n=1 Tax=Haemonchus contortus TaxID=6289 RepID=A0A7I4Z3I5_HAECO
MKRRNTRVLCLQETRWKGAKGREIGKGVKPLYNGEDTKISSRIVAVRIGTKEEYWTIISVYAPQAGCPIYEKDKFYLSFDEAIRSVPEGDYLTIGGGLNGHIGSERRGQERIHGGRGVGVRNEEGKRVLDLAIAHNLAGCSIFFAKRKSQKVTYSSGGKETEIDHVLIRRSSLKTIKDIKSLAKTAVAKAKNTESDALYEKLYSREGEKFVFRLVKARHPATQDVGVVKSVRNSEGAS